MKRSADSFLASTNNGYTPYTSVVTGHNVNNGTNLLMIVPEDVFIRIFSTFSITTLRQLSLVCKTFEVYAKKDILWQRMAEAVLFPHEIESKPKEIGYKEHCKTWLSLTDLGRIVHSHDCFDKPREPDILEPRDPKFINFLKQIQLPDYKLLSPSEAQALMDMKDSKKLVEAVWNDIPRLRLRYNHIAQQQVGTIKINFLNCTPWVISFNSERKMQIIDSVTQIGWPPADGQLLIYFSLDTFILRIYYSYIGNDQIFRMDLPGFNELNRHITSLSKTCSCSQSY